MQAGCDIIIQNYDFQGSIDAIEKAVLNGQISEERINESALKMLKMKQKVGLNIDRFVSLNNMLMSLGKIRIEILLSV